MSAATVASPVQTAATVVKKSAGEVAIERAAKAGCPNSTMCKAIWSTRGDIYAPVAGFEFNLKIVKSDLTGMLQNLPAGDACGFHLVPMEGGGCLIHND